MTQITGTGSMSNPVGLDLAPAKVLLLEDNEGDRLLLAEALKDASRSRQPGTSIQLVHVERLSQALQELAAGKFKAALVDLDLPDSQGIETVQALRRAAPSLPIVVMTGNLDSEAPLEALSSGAQDFLIKGQHSGEAILRTIRFAMERQRFAARLEQQEAFNRTVLASLTANIAVVGANGEILAVNDAWRRFARENGGDPQELGPGRNYLEVCRKAADGGEELAAQVLKGLRQVLDGERSRFELEYPCPAPDQERWFKLIVTPFAGKEAGAVLAHEDITNRLLSERRIARRESRLRSILENSPDVVARLDLEGRHLYISPAIEKRTGRKAEEYLGKTDRELGVNPERARKWRRAREKVQQTGETQTFELEHMLDGELRHYRVELHPEFGEGGQVKTFLAMSHEITDLRRANQRLGERETVLQAVTFASERYLSPDGWRQGTPAVLERLGRAVGVSRCYLWQNSETEQGRLLASQVFEWAARPNYATPDQGALQSIPYDDLGFERWAKIMGDGGVVQGRLADFPVDEQEFLKPQDIESLLAVPVFVGDEWWGFVGFDDCERSRTWDTSIVDALRTASAVLGAAIQSERTEAELAAREQRFRALVEHSSDAVVIVDEQRIIRYVSPSVKNVLGYEEDDLLGVDGNALIHPEDLARARAEVGQQGGLVTGELDRTELRLRHADGQWRWVEMVRTNLSDEPAVDGTVINFRDISERRKAAQALRRSEEHFRSLIEGATDLTALLSPDGEILYASPSITRILGYEVEAVEGRPVFEFVHTEDLPLAAEILLAYREGADPSALVDLRLRTAEGGWRYLSAIGRRYEGGDYDAIIVNARDVTDERELNQELRRERDLFSVVAETSPAGITMVDASGEVVFANPRAEKILGIAPSEAGRRRYNDPRWRISAQDGGPMEADELPFATVMRTGEPVYDVRHAIEGPDGTRKLLSVNGAPVKDNAGQVISVVLTIEDISDKQVAEQALRRSEQRYRQLFELNQAAVFQSTYEGELLEYNRAFAELFGLPVDESGDAEYSVLDLYVDPQDREPFLLALAEHGYVNQFELRMKRTDGTPIWVLSSSSLLDSEGPDPVLQGTLLDVTEQRNAQQQLAANERRFRSLVQNTNDIITVVDEDGVVRYESPSLERVLGYAPADVLGLHVFDPVHPEDRPQAEAAFAELLENPDSEMRVELRLRAADGELRYLEVVGTNLLADPAVEGVVFNSRDVTERRRRSQEQEAVLRVAAALRSARNRAEMPPVILGELSELLETDSVAMVAYDELDDVMVIERGLGAWQTMEGRRLERGTGLSWRVQARAEPLEVEDLRTEAAFADSKYASDPYAGLGVPMIVRDRVIGVVWLARERAFTSDEVRIAAAVADMSANALNRAALHEETQRRAEQLASVSVLGQTLGQALDEGFVNERLAKATLALLPEACTVLISRYDSKEKSFSLAYGVDQGEPIDTSGLPNVALEQPGQGGQSEVVHAREPFILNDLDALYEKRPDSRMGTGPFTKSALYVPMITRGKVVGVLQAQSLLKSYFTQQDVEIMTVVANTAAVALSNAHMFHEIQTSNVQLSLAYDTTLEGWAKALELRDQETEGHTRRVTDMTVKLALELEVPPSELVDIRRGALLHDIGKMGIPDNILLKPGPLDDDEWEVMRRHPVYARDMLAEVDYVSNALDIPYYHHERWDGSGYPEGLAGDEIPLPARIFAVVDVYDALCSDRPYRDAWQEERVIEYLRENAGVQFDPHIVNTFLAMLNAGE